MTDQKPKSQAIMAWEDFRTEITNRENEIASMLPSHVSKERFINSAVAAVKQTPGLLNATPRSLFASVTKSAQDGLLPDGREGVITVYREKQPDNSWQESAAWNPMVYGLRKRAREIDGIIVNAQVVYENDDFLWHEGDDPKIEHRPAPLGEPRGPMVGAYAIFKNDKGILHREVMDAEQVQAVRGQSKQPNGIMWTKFTAEAWRKTVVRRGFKSIPCSEHLQVIVQRDDDLFAFNNTDAAPPALVSPRPVRSDFDEPVDGAADDQVPSDAVPADEPVDPTTYPLVSHYGEVIGEFQSGDWGDEYVRAIEEAAATGIEKAVDTFIDNNADTAKAIGEAGIDKVTKLIAAAVLNAYEIRKKIAAEAATTEAAD